MFIEDNCILCGECFTECHWIEADIDQATQWIGEIIQGEPSEVLSKCITCFSCNERCPQGANPFDRIAELQDKYRTLLSEDAIQKMEQKFTFTGTIKEPPKAGKVMSLCIFERSHSQLIQGEIYDLPRVSGKPYFCWLMLGHAGAQSIQKKHAQEFVDRLAKTGAKEVICFHDDCYTMLKRDAPEYGIEVPFRPVHLAEHMCDFLSAHQDKLKPLNLNIAYQRPCASKLTPEKEQHIDKFFSIAGVKRVEREYDRENGMCCGGAAFMLEIGDPSENRMKNIRDAQKAGAQAMVCLCPMCMEQLGPTAKEMNLPLIFIGDIARMALGEIEAPV